MSVDARWRREWTKKNPIPGKNTLAIDLNDNSTKLGDGVTRWIDLKPFPLLSNSVGVSSPSSGSDPEVASAISNLNALVASKQDSSTATTDPELLSAVQSLTGLIEAKQDSATAATDPELASAVSNLNALIANKQDASTAATDTELTNAVNTLNATLASKQDASTAATDAELAAALASYTIGKEIGYAERGTTDTSTSTPDDNATLNANLIAGLSVPIVGIGRPVEVELYHPLVTHTVINGVVYGTIMQDGVRIAQTPAVITKAGTGQGPLIVKRRVVIPTGTSVTFTVAKTIDTAGTATWYANDATQMVAYLSVTQR